LTEFTFSDIILEKERESVINRTDPEKGSCNWLHKCEVEEVSGLTNKWFSHLIDVLYHLYICSRILSHWYLFIKEAQMLLLLFSNNDYVFSSQSWLPSLYK